MFISKFRQWFSSEALSSEQLMQNYADSAQKSDLEQLLQRHGDDLYYYLLSQTDKFTAEDLSQQTWITVIDKRHLYKQQGQFKFWLFKLARNKLIDELRKQNKHLCENDFDSVCDFKLNDHLLDDSSNHNSGDMLLEKKQQQQTLKQMLCALPQTQKEAIVLQQEGFSLNDIAVITNSPVETIKARLRYARNNLKSNGGMSHD